ncbi:hypothetical protein DACRYDRAFT_23330 [Dacryopinax primogenitus]|uniref:Aminoglycoside phosphotransferase domain-containing protein n=1 Tax=Dacryopinax primogenitus (strain DJM 731) TaxID=1858805 RepID=M5FSK4_DACPD|nr:uncharacterized protein DACRYDRAFT_23330 [Dacryopinax primogenitus]EJU00441.1 hypothetical protein DACRYDRAFT_23330 [Dacryopinax primogenitus]
MSTSCAKFGFRDVAFLALTMEPMKPGCVKACRSKTRVPRAFNNAQELGQWYQKKRLIVDVIGMAWHRDRPTIPVPPLDHSTPLFFTHGDINLRNVRVDAVDQIWLVDWGRAGFYPDWFQYACMRVFADHLPKSWADLIPAMVEEHIANSFARSSGPSITRILFCRRRTR